MITDKITFFRSYYEVGKFLKAPKDYKLFYEGMFAYVFDGIEPDFSTSEHAQLAWVCVRPYIDKSLNKKRFGNENAKRKSNANETQNERKSNANETQNEFASRIKKLEEEKEKEKEADASKKTTTAPLFNHPSSASEVVEHARIGGDVCSEEEAQQFIDYFSATAEGETWVISGKPISNWRKLFDAKWRKGLREKRYQSNNRYFGNNMPQVTPPIPEDKRF